MPGRGTTPKAPDERHNPREKPQRGDWHNAPGTGWQHGPTPKPPPKLTKAAKDAWAIWFGSWVAAHWAERDLPALRQLVRLYDQVERGEFVRHAELRIVMDTFGLTPKGLQDRRWLPPKAEDVAVRAKKGDTTYGHLKAVN